MLDILADALLIATRLHPPPHHSGPARPPSLGGDREPRNPRRRFFTLMGLKP